MIKTNAILEFAEDLIHQKTDTYCSELQRRILIAALQDERKTYDQLAEECGYSARYVKQDVAPKLWLLISQAVGKKVNKANVRAALEATMRNHTAPQPLKYSRWERQLSQHQISQQLSSQAIASPEASQSEISYKEQTDSQYITDQYTEKKETSFLIEEPTAAYSAENPASTLPIGETNGNSILPAVGGKANILLIDDQPQNLKLLSDLLEEQGYEVQQAINGVIALQAIRSSPPDLILLDIHMPRMDGYMLCQHLKTDEKTAGIPVIFVSAIDDPWDKVRAFSAGGCDYITKPFKVVEVLARVDNHLKIQQLQKALISQNIKLQSAIRELQRLAAIDEITQVASRRRFDAHLLSCWQQASRARVPLTLMLVQVNSLGAGMKTQRPPLGDRTLRYIAQIVQQTAAGAQDLVARYGTLTFAVVLPCQTKTEGRAIAQKIVEQVQISSNSSSPLSELSSRELTSETNEQSPGRALSVGISSIDFSMQEPAYLGIGEFLEASEQILQIAQKNGEDIADS